MLTSQHDSTAFRKSESGLPLGERVRDVCGYRPLTASATSVQADRLTVSPRRGRALVRRALSTLLLDSKPHLLPAESLEAFGHNSAIIACCDEVSNMSMPGVLLSSSASKLPDASQAALPPAQASPP